MRPRPPAVRRSVIIAATLTLVLGACSDDKGDEMKILDNDTEVGGAPTADLLRDYARNFIVTPSAENMLVDPSKCDMGLSTDAVYFAPTWGSAGDSSAACTMQSDQVLFLSPVGGYCFEDGTDHADDACLDSTFNVTTSGVTIDGEPVDDLDSHLVQFDAQDIEVPDGNLVELPAGAVKTIGRGHVVLVDGLPTGTHEIVLSGDFGNGEFAGSLTLTMTVE